MDTLWVASLINILLVRKSYCGWVNLGILISLVLFILPSKRFVIRFRPSMQTLVKHLRLPLLVFVLYWPALNLIEFSSSRSNPQRFVMVPFAELYGFFLIYPFAIPFFLIFVKVRRRVSLNLDPAMTAKS